MMPGLLDKALGREAAIGPQGPAPAAEAGLDVGRIQNDPAFQRMDAASQQKVLQSLGVQAPDQPSSTGSIQRPVADGSQGVPQRRDMPINSAVPGELKKSLVDPSYRLLTGRSSGFWETSGDVLSTGQVIGAGAAALAASTPPGAAMAAGSVLLAPVVGATVRGLLTDFNVSSGWSTLLGGIAEIGTGGVQALSGWRNMMKTGRGLIGEAKAAGMAGEGGESVLASQRMGKAIISRASNAFEVRAQPIRRVIDGLEGTASKLKVGRGDPAYGDVEFLVQKARELRVTTPEIAKLEKQLETGIVDMKDVVELRKGLENGLNYARSVADPNLPANAKLAREIRGYATDSITTSLGTEAGARYGESLLAWRTQVRDPQRVLRAVMSKNLEPSTAFELVYGSGATPEVIQTLSQLRDVDPTFRATLRLGAMQHFFAAAGGNLRQSVAGSKAFKTLAPMLSTTGLFSHEEMIALKLFMKPGLIDTAMANLGATVSGRTSRVLHMGLSMAGAGTSGSAIYHLMANHPQIGFLAIVASGGLPALRRIVMAPPGSTTAAAAGAAVVRGLTGLGSALANRPSEELND